MDGTPAIRQKAWERAEYRGFVTKAAAIADVNPQTARRWFLEPGHPDRREIRSAEIRRKLAYWLDLQPNDFLWLRGEKAARRRARKAELERRKAA